MKNAKLKIGLIAVASLGMMWGSASAFAAEKRCTAGGQKVECPTVTEAEAKAASAAFLKEGDDMEKGRGGSTYGIAPFDYLTGVGKRANSDLKTYKTHSGYGSDTKAGLKTELWDRVKAPKSDGVKDKACTINGRVTGLLPLVQRWLPVPIRLKEKLLLFLLYCVPWLVDAR